MDGIVSRMIPGTYDVSFQQKLQENRAALRVCHPSGMATNPPPTGQTSGKEE